MIEQTVESFDGTKIALNHFRQNGRSRVVIVCHGFGMSKDAVPFLALSADLFRYEDVLAMDLRGHGKSGGTFSFSAKEPRDIEAVINYARQGYGQVYLLGFSLGAAACIIEVGQRKNVQGLIAVSAPISFGRIENRFLDKGVLMLALQNLKYLLLNLRLGSIFMRKTRPIDVIAQISPVPLLIIHGEKDPIVFAHHARSLYQKAREPKQLVMVKDGWHAEALYWQNPQDFINLCVRWLQRWPGNN